MTRPSLALTAFTPTTSGVRGIIRPLILSAVVCALGWLVPAGPAFGEAYDRNTYIDTTLNTLYQAPFLTGIDSDDINLRWKEDTPHSSRMSVNLCSNYGYYWARDFAAHSTSYHLMTTLPNRTCFVVRGYSNLGSWVKFQTLLYTT